MRDQEIARTIGQRVRRLRQERGLTLREIESRSGVSATHVSEVERGKTSPTVGVLERIGVALGVRPGVLLEACNELRPLVVSSQQRRCRSFPDSGALIEALTQAHGPCAYSVCLVNLPADALFEANDGHPGEEFCYVLEGAIEVSHAEVPYVVSAREGLHFRATSRHAIRNATRSPARFLWASRPRAAL